MFQVAIGFSNPLAGKVSSYIFFDHMNSFSSENLLQVAHNGLTAETHSTNTIPFHGKDTQGYNEQIMILGSSQPAREARITISEEVIYSDAETQKLIAKAKEASTAV